MHHIERNMPAIGRHLEQKCVPVRHEGDDDPRRWHCDKCTFTDIDAAGHFPDLIIRTCKITRAPGLGDYVSALLSMFAITKPRVNWVARKVGLTGCGGCGERQEAMNDAGWRITGWAKSWLRRAEAK